MMIVPKVKLIIILLELAYQCAESYEYLETGWDDDFENEDDREAYYENALSYCGWNYCSKEEYIRGF